MIFDIAPQEPVFKVIIESRIVVFPQKRSLFFWLLPTVARHAFFYLMDYIKIHFHKSNIRMRGVMSYFYGLPYLHNHKIQDDHYTF